jgi:replicative DNA helicase
VSIDDAPIPLHAMPEPAPIPLDAFPDWVADFVRAVAVEHQVPTDFPALFVLGVAAVGGGGRVWVQVPGRNWREPTNLYVAAALPSGFGKTPVINQVRQPLIATTEALVAEATPALQRNATARTVLRTRLKQAERQAAAADNDTDREQLLSQAAELRQQLAQVGPVLPPRLLAGDATPEAIAAVLAANDNRIGIISDEGGIFDLLSGRYGTRVWLDPYLQGHSGGRIETDRIGRGEGHEHHVVDSAHLTVAVGLQPDVIAELNASGRLVGRGLLARFLYANPCAAVGHRNPNPPPAPEGVIATYRTNMSAVLADLCCGPFTGPTTLTLDTDALDAFTAHRSSIEAGLRPDGRLTELHAWGNKLAGHTLRIAGLLHLLRHPTNTTPLTIPPGTLADAIRISNALIDHALSIHDLMGETPRLADARRLLTRLHDTGAGSVCTRSAMRLVSSFKTAEQAGDAIQTLLTYGWLQKTPSDGAPHTGRPRAPEYTVVHPDST